MNLFIVFFIPLLVSVNCQSEYILGDQGDSCNEACFKLGMNCNPRIETNNSTSLFTQFGINCTNDPSVWEAEDQPSYVSDKSDPNGNYGKCLGYISVPAGSQCAGSFWSVSRICRCDTPSSSPSTFGAGYSNGMITTEEKWIFEQVLAPEDVGVLTHFWITYGTSVDNGVIVRYYIDGEKNASIQFTPSLACGVGYYDYHGPWGTKWFGKGANDAGWFNNFRIPFQKSIVVTVQHLYGNFSGFYMIVRGSINIPISVGGITLPRNARMNQFVINGTYQPLEFVPLVNISSGPGVHWMVTISAGSNNLNFLEGCFHAYFDGNNAFPGVVLSTGTEEYFDSAWYFNAGQFHLPVSGLTHFNHTDTSVTWSAYRFHEMDPLFFKHGFQLVWRIGDIYDAAYMKCMMLTGSNIAGSPGPTEVIAYAWVYTWEEDIATTSSTSLSTPSLSTTIPTTQEPTTISTTQEPTTISTTEELTTIPTTQESTTISTTEESDPPQSTHKASSADKIEINFIGRLWSLLVCLVIMHLRH